MKNLYSYRTKHFWFEIVPNISVSKGWFYPHLGLQMAMDWAVKGDRRLGLYFHLLLVSIYFDLYENG